MMSDATMSTGLLFVYGTLRRDLNGQAGKYHYYLQGAEYLGRGRTKDEYALYAEEYAMVFRGETVSRIAGEVYRIANQKQAAAIDELEEGYDKVTISVVLDDSREISASIYQVSRPAGELIRSGDYADFLKMTNAELTE
jgi:gamma-glutamylcyclotransferase (GGCT)/AIG2-like uncharacterized protein YtfP